jgi:hypothetical protein
MLVLFGDSFVSEWEGEYPSWFKLLATELQTEFKTYGVIGSSFEYSLLKFFEYLHSPEYDPTDQIIFVLTTAYRSPVISKDFSPQWAAMLNSKIFYNQLDKESQAQVAKLTDSDDHYRRFNTFYKDWISLQNMDLILAQRYMLLSTLHNLPNNTASVSVGDTDYAIAKKFNNHATMSLSEVSTNEFIDGDAWHYIKKYGTQDHRTNHLSEQNHHILKNVMYSCLIDGDCSRFSVDSFQKNLLSIT